jgi:phage replication-related protein YjqB (UPF0714/DUF867 family)
MKADLYPDFNQLNQNERRGVDFETKFALRSSPCAFLAPHGGTIEPWTDTIVEMLAGKESSFYVFRSIRPAGKRGTLHITSTNFDDPDALRIAESADYVLAIHGRSDRVKSEGRDDKKMIFVGGLSTELAKQVAHNLSCAGFSVQLQASGPLAGVNPRNICNRGRMGMGVQLELPRTLRNQLQKNSALMEKLTNAIRSALP